MLNYKINVQQKLKEAGYSSYRLRCYGQTSHPAWVRELKHPNISLGNQFGVSHPAWVRELKLVCGCGYTDTCRSHPAWVRELKPER